MNKLEYKYSKYAIKNLSLYLVIAYALGCFLYMALGDSFILACELNPYLIFHGQVWRLFTWVFIPSNDRSLFSLIFLFFSYRIGKNLENAWGSFKLNLYIFTGLLFVLIGSFVLYGITRIEFADLIAEEGAKFVYTSYPFLPDGRALPEVWFEYCGTYYIIASFWLAFAVTYGESQILIQFIIPVKAKYFGVIYAVGMIYEFIVAALPERIIMAMSFVSFLFLFFCTMGYFNVYRKIQFRRRVKAGQRKYRDAAEDKNIRFVNPERGVITKHKCAICGRTELDDPNLEFRFCSKCNGNYEYCSEHLYTHVHVK